MNILQQKLEELIIQYDYVLREYTSDDDEVQQAFVTLNRVFEQVMN